MASYSNGIFVTAAPLGDLAARLITVCQQQSDRAVVLTTNKLYVSEDNDLQKVINFVAERYSEKCKHLLNQDAGYVLSSYRPEYREVGNTFDMFVNRVQASVDKAALVLALHDSDYVLRFPNQGCRVPLKRDCAIVFPSNWYFTPELAQGNDELFLVTTYLTTHG